MSDWSENDISPEVIEAAKLRDGRIRQIDETLAIEAELRDSVALKALLAQYQKDADAAFLELAEVSPADQTAIAGLLVKVRSLVYIHRSLNYILNRGHAAMAEVQAMEETFGDAPDS